MRARPSSRRTPPSAVTRAVRVGLAVFLVVLALTTASAVAAEPAGAAPGMAGVCVVDGGVPVAWTASGLRVDGGALAWSGDAVAMGCAGSDVLIALHMGESDAILRLRYESGALRELARVPVRGRVRGLAGDRDTIVASVLVRREGALVLYREPYSGRPTSIALAEPPQALAVASASGSLFAATGASLRVFALPAGTSRELLVMPGPVRALAAPSDPSTLLLAVIGSEVVGFDLRDRRERGALPLRAVGVALPEGHVAVAFAGPSLDAAWLAGIDGVPRRELLTAVAVVETVESLPALPKPAEMADPHVAPVPSLSPTAPASSAEVAPEPAPEPAPERSLEPEQPEAAPVAEAPRAPAPEPRPEDQPVRPEPSHREASPEDSPAPIAAPQVERTQAPPAPGEIVVALTGAVSIAGEIDVRGPDNRLRSFARIRIDSSTGGSVRIPNAPAGRYALVVMGPQGQSLATVPEVAEAIVEAGKGASVEIRVVRVR